MSLSINKIGSDTRIRPI